MEYHVASKAFPMMDDKRYKELVEDIAENGQHVPIVLCNGQILDGRNRHKACNELGIEPITTKFDGDPWAYVWSLNGERRDIVAEQRYLIWKLCHENSEAFQAEKQRIADEANRARSEAMQGVAYAPKGETRKPEKVGEQSVPEPSGTHPERKAKAKASKTNAGAVARGDQLAAERPDLAEKVRAGEIKPAEAHRQMKKDMVVETTKTLPAGKYTVIYADPPWKYNDALGGSISENYGGAEKHYPTMTLNELQCLDIQSISNDDAVLWLWSTCPLLEDALALAKAWGFKYKAQFVWDKIKHNMGHYNSVRHEILLICTRGSCTPENMKLFDSVQSIERTEHSRKPEAFRTIIETLYPSASKIELFRRGEQIDGWTVWGNETE